MERNMTISFYAFYRGTSKSKEAMAFRRWFYKLSELRSLVQNKIPFMAVTATASRQTKETITSVLRFGNFVEVSQSPNKPNICYSIQTMDKRTPLLQYFQWILNELTEKKGGTERTIIYCQTIKQCSTLYSLFMQEMGDSIFANLKKVYKGTMSSIYGEYKVPASRIVGARLLTATQTILTPLR